MQGPWSLTPSLHLQEPHIQSLSSGCVVTVKSKVLRGGTRKCCHPPGLFSLTLKSNWLFSIDLYRRRDAGNFVHLISTQLVKGNVGWGDPGHAVSIWVTQLWAWVEALVCGWMPGWAPSWVRACSHHPWGHRRAVAGGHTCTVAWPLGDRRPSTRNHLEMQVPGGGLQRGLTGYFLSLEEEMVMHWRLSPPADVQK